MDDVEEQRHQEKPEHDWRRIMVERVEVENHVMGLPTVKPTGEIEVRIGCWVCDMDVEEGWDLPCPGRSLEEMVEEP